MADGDANVELAANKSDGEGASSNPVSALSRKRSAMADEIQRIKDRAPTAEEESYRNGYDGDLLCESIVTLRQKCQYITWISFNIMAIHKIDLSEQVFTADFVVSLRWYASVEHAAVLASVVFEEGGLLVGREDEKIAAVSIGNLNHSNLKGIRINDLKITNEVDAQRETWLRIFHHKNAPDDTRFEFILNNRCTGTFSERLELANFPFDIQNLKINCVSHWNDCILLFDKELVTAHLRRQNFHLQEYVLHYPVMLSLEDRVKDHWTDELNPCVTHELDSKSRDLYSMAILVTRCRRTGTHYFWNHFSVLFLVSSSCLTSILVDLENFHDRITIGLTLLLTIVAFKFVLIDHMPKTGYLTIMDAYIQGCFYFIGAIIIENVYALIFLKDDREKENIVGFVCMGVWLFLNMLFALYALVLRYRVLSMTALTDAVFEDYLGENKKKKKEGQWRFSRKFVQ